MKIEIKFSEDRMKNIFFIIGAPKCGTTALYEYLSSRQDVFMPDLKEPHYFAVDYPDIRTITSQEEYASLFRFIPSQCKAVGESSAWYLYSEIALRRIRQEFPDAKFIVAVRNPVEMVESLHRQLLYSFREGEKSLLTAWKLQESRSQGQNLPKGASSGKYFQYRRLASHGKSLSELYKIVPKDNVKVVLFDDLKGSPRDVYLSILDFLGLPDDGRSVFPVVNPRKAHRFPRLAKFLISPPAPLATIKRILRRRFFKGRASLMRPFYALLSIGDRGSVVSREFLDEVSDQFHADIDLLSSLIDRDLSSWKKVSRL